MIGGLLVAVVAIGVVGAGLIGLFNPFSTKTVDRTPPVLLNKISDLADYHAATGTFEVLVDLEKDVKHLPAAIAGERTFFVGIGNVDAVVDFASVTPERIAVSADRKSVTITVPAPTLSKPTLDINQSHVAARSRGLLNRIGGIFTSTPTNDKVLYEAADAKLAEAARQSELTERGKDNTRKMLTSLAGALGYTNVTVVFQDPAPPTP